MIALLALFGLALQPAPASHHAGMYPGMENLSVVRYLRCNEGTGSGFIAADGVIATALHVASMTGCRDAETGNEYKTYHRDTVHDFALMGGVTPDMAPAKVDCKGYVSGKSYVALGITSFQERSALFRRVTLTANGYENIVVGGMEVNGIRQLDGYIVPGMSGGPIDDAETGKVVGITNVGYFGNNGDPLGISYSYELKDTILCKH